MRNLSPEQRAERDDLVAGLLANAAPSGLTEYDLTRRIRARAGRGGGVIREGGSTAQTSLRRLEAAGRARCVEEPWPCHDGFRRVWFAA